jgi:hypothetical protein
MVATTMKMRAPMAATTAMRGRRRTGDATGDATGDHDFRRP